MLNVAVRPEELPGREHEVADGAALRVVVVQPVDVRLDGVPRPEHFLAFGTRVVGVEVVPLDVVCEVGHGGVPVLANHAHPEDGPRLVAVLDRHRRDQLVQLWKYVT